MSSAAAMNARMAEDFKGQGNVFFQSGDFPSAERLYTQAIIHNATSPTYFTNRALSRLRLQNYEGVISDCHHALELLPSSLKAYTYLGQAQLALDRPNEALSSSQQAYKLALAQRSPSAGAIAQTVLAAKKRRWEVCEERRILEESRALGEMVEVLERDCRREVRKLRKRYMRSRDRNYKSTSPDEPAATVRGQADARRNNHLNFRRPDLEEDEDGDTTLPDAYPDDPQELQEEIDAMTHATSQRISHLKAVFARADPELCRSRVVPENLIDSITFTVMHDPVVTKTGHSYDRATILEHLRRSRTDPLTREPLSEEDLRPNIALRGVCEEFLKDNGWAVDW